MGLTGWLLAEEISNDFGAIKDVQKVDFMSRNDVKHECLQWHSLSREEQAKYYEKARQERQKHMQMYPHWNARDNYRFGLKKKKRKRDKTDDPGTTFLRPLLNLVSFFSGTPCPARSRPSTTRWPSRSGRCI